MISLFSPCHLSAALLISALFIVPTNAAPSPVSSPFTVNATVLTGCVLGGGATDSSNFGSINFGNITSLATAINATSGLNAGTITIQCNGNPSVTLALNSGANMTGNISAGRHLLNSSTGEYLLYQIYQNSPRTLIWVDGSNGGATQVIATDGTLQQVILYAQLFASNTQPTAGVYLDTLLVTVTY
ncbi:spore Coat Protein U domain protein [Yersinia pseudotuberculosis IP 32953]|uniref:Putative exported protein n=1 Tax=Yersinia pseudotuberculosis serotype I (strain IP32953) TaxID=273123 RepID=Q669U9_YERPS|nr:spore coat U domain-containing protein [Yersinia pseudotuberculosis]AJJ54548.1 spore Coat Protein U domain protein [Yersinia pseudotuberculosis IP 32953]PSH45710.1 spore coat protein U [Yersinia pseudotuberculosis]PSH51121.1 spore coat protein U [Yersinia pseudotuberculosis]CAH21621.1 putative exported protein [Yersinia pseudotuberculosis IP 32953]